ncbi:peptidase G1 [Boletus edulis]|nr:peptidase G1 [Boletus edulis]
MRFNSVLISSFFASAVLAASSRERSLFRVADTLPLSDNLAGDVVTPVEPGNIEYVTSTIRVPDIAGQEVAAIVFISIDSFGACPNMLLLGVVFDATADKPYTPMYEYHVGTNESKGIIHDVQIAAGDAIKLIVDAPVDAKIGNITVHNLSNNQNYNYQFNFTENLCGKTAVWGVADLMFQDTTARPVNFGTLIFANAVVGGDDFKTLDHQFVNIVQNGKNLTNVTADINDDLVTVTWL